MVQLRATARCRAGARAGPAACVLTPRDETTASSRAERGAGRELLLAAAERLIAEQGESVSLKEVALAAGQRNNSAVNYHFGDRDGLVEAVVLSRLSATEPVRVEHLAALEAQGRGDDPSALVSALVLPMFDAPYRLGATHYARFLERVRNHEAVRRLGTEPSPHNASVRIVLARLGRLLEHLPAPLRAARIRAFTSVMFALLADHERLWDRRDEADGAELAAREEVVRVLVAMLWAPGPP